MEPVEHFRKYFTICPAMRKDMLNQIYRVRYQVYCIEFGYVEKESLITSQYEIDQYEYLSRHCLLMHNPTAAAIGGVRLIEANPQYPDRLLPFEKYCSHAINREVFDPGRISPGSLAEFSRLAVVKRFRCRSTDGNGEIPYPELTEKKQKNRIDFPVIPISLMLSALSMLKNSEAEIGVAMMEPKLVRMMKMFGIIFEKVGSNIQYHGVRAPYIIHKKNIRNQLKTKVLDLFDEVDAHMTMLG